MHILLLDIETAPNLAHVWGLWDQNVSLNQLIDSGYILCWTAKWLGKEGVFFSSRQKNTKKGMLKSIHSLLNEADAVVHYNGRRFDVPWLNREFITCGFKPPSPYKEIDLLETVKKSFKFPSNKLEYVSKALGVGEKIKTTHELWIGCMKNDPKCWELMQEYNIRDVVLLERVYEKLLPWIKGHANYSMLSANTLVCPNCGGNNAQRRGFSYTLASKFQRYQCKDCGHWFKDNKRLNTKDYKTSSIV